MPCSDPCWLPLFLRQTDSNWFPPQSSRVSQVRWSPHSHSFQRALHLLYPPLLCSVWESAVRAWGVVLVRELYGGLPN